MHVPSQTLFEQVASLVEREFYDVTFLRNEWPPVRARFAEDYANASDIAAREAAVVGLLDALGVSHAILITPAMAPQIARQADDPERFRSGIVRCGATLVARIPSFNVRSTRRADLQRLVDAFAGTRTLVLDLRLNNGGASSVLSELASMFLLSETPVLRVRDRTGGALDAPIVVPPFPESENLEHRPEIAFIRDHHYVEY